MGKGLTVIPKEEMYTSADLAKLLGTSPSYVSWCLKTNKFAADGLSNAGKPMFSEERVREILNRAGIKIVEIVESKDADGTSDTVEQLGS